jgi:hypothetical protein
MAAKKCATSTGKSRNPNAEQKNNYRHASPSAAVAAPPSQSPNPKWRTKGNGNPLCKLNAVQIAFAAVGRHLSCRIRVGDWIESGFGPGFQFQSRRYSPGIGLSPDSALDFHFNPGFAP